MKTIAMRASLALPRSGIAGVRVARGGLNSGLSPGRLVSTGVAALHTRNDAKAKRKGSLAAAERTGSSMLVCTLAEARPSKEALRMEM